jgi:hypothetical protein
LDAQLNDHIVKKCEGILELFAVNSRTALQMVGRVNR